MKAIVTCTNVTGEELGQVELTIKYGRPIHLPLDLLPRRTRVIDIDYLTPNSPLSGVDGPADSAR